ncbi:site-specific DNA-methyltransferase [Candidatus Poribacteria bacterium]|nr:site-specific DNA-methyltransferase [Candidatus Poribacteria bacterium]MBT5536784.1 site-specific DNA-methyltransferase [Candidatus Poribacteria bacterium]MBT5714816.1 site-specific DNA-methyltransferase [Candidatus Poribacteria bacterium]MBT7100823.1 site-specific DNA-methyltransferase [Candidatus Poribacteria bacterium]MBT7806322.1 site-specific DNA-methyltransferase [Candidatus Poribacteria bacterium]
MTRFVYASALRIIAWILYMTLPEELRRFAEFGAATAVTATAAADGPARSEVATYTNSFWSPKQRGGHSLHEVSYRACFKPELPRFFIDRLTRPGDVVYDPFVGRGTTSLEAALRGRVPLGCDVNPLSRALLDPRLRPPTLDEVSRRLDEIDLSSEAVAPEDLLAFYHPATLQQICALRSHLQRVAAAGEETVVDGWIRMVALGRLTGHSSGFFSVYTMPPNQAVSVASQLRINARRDQTPPQRDIRHLILRKSKALLRDCHADTRSALADVAPYARTLTASANHTPDIGDGEVDLVVTSPPFLDVVDYAKDNWLRAWFCGIDPASVRFTTPKSINAWRDAMTAVFRELARVVRPGGHVAFEVGEVRKGACRLEEHVIPCGLEAGLDPVLIVVNAHRFTKTANCWGVANGRQGTNTNRVVLFRK